MTIDPEEIIKSQKDAKALAERLFPLLRNEPLLNAVNTVGELCAIICREADKVPIETIIASWLFHLEAIAQDHGIKLTDVIKLCGSINETIVTLMSEENTSH